MMPILCFPSVKGSDLTLSYMNWTVLVYGGPMTVVIIWWFVSARHWFKGPVVNVEHQMLGREGNVLEGQDRSSDSDGAIISDKKAELV